jgi:alkylation response protein AidB-like acyl-CoA dehydrogenase
MEIRHTTTPKLEQLREEIRTWLEEELPPENEGFLCMWEEDPEQWDFYREFWLKQGSKRWLEPGWQWEFGGAEMSPRQQRVLREELNRRRVSPLPGIGTSVGSAIQRVGTLEQKQFFLPGMASGEVMWAEGYTEPDSGSDLASLRTRAELDGDEWVISGQKTFNTAAHQMNWIIVAARTAPDPKLRHRGISYFLCPTDAPGLEMRPLYNMTDGRQNMLFFDDVRLPRNGLLGTLNQGWEEVWFGIGGEPLPTYPESDPGPEIEYEPPIAGDAWILDQLIKYCRQTIRYDQPLIEDALVRKQLTDLAIDIEAHSLLQMETKCEFGPVYLHSAINKEFEPKFAQTCMEILGPLSVIQSGPWAPLAGEIDRMYRRSFGNHGGGTPQVKRMVVATRTLGLPR